VPHTTFSPDFVGHGFSRDTKVALKPLYRSAVFSPSLLPSFQIHLARARQMGVQLFFAIIVFVGEAPTRVPNWEFYFSAVLVLSFRLTLCYRHA
jgi:hypothetical protein